MKFCRGYMAPEYIDKGVISTKQDIFSLGVIIVEMIRGHRLFCHRIMFESQEFIESVRGAGKRGLLSFMY